MNKSLSCLLSLLIVNMSVYSQSYLFTESSNSKGTTQGPFTGSSLSAGLSNDKVKFSLNTDSIGFIRIHNKKPFYASGEVSGKTQNRILKLSNGNRISKQFNAAAGFGIRYYRDFTIPELSKLDHPGDERTYSNLKWVHLGGGYEFEDFLRVYPDSVYYKQVEKYNFTNYFLTFTAGSFSMNKSRGRMKRMEENPGIDTIYLEREFYSFLTFNAYLGNSNNKNDLTEVDVDDLILQNAYGDTIRSYYQKQKAYLGDYLEQTQVTLRVDLTLIRHKSRSSQNKKSEIKKTDCVECCDTKPRYNMAYNIYVTEEIRNGDLKYTSLGVGVNIIENVHNLFKDRKALGNKFNLLAGLAFEIRYDNKQKPDDPIEVLPTFKTGVTF